MLYLFKSAYNRELKVIKLILAKYKMPEAKASKIPMDPDYIKNASEDDVKLTNNTKLLDDFCI